MDDVATYGPRLTEWLRARGLIAAPSRVVAMSRPGAGYSKNTLLVTVTPHHEPTLVLRLPPDHPTHQADNLKVQADVIEVLAAQGLPAPAPATYEPDASWLGMPFTTMACVSGHVAGEVPALDPWITGSTPELQRHLYDGFTDAIADLHALDPVAIGAAGVVPGVDDSLDDDIRFWERYLDWATEHHPVPELVHALEKCRATRPREEPKRALLWGDVRIGNAIFDEGRNVRALIDWETARIGPPEFDVGWWLGLEAVTHELLGRRVEGFPRPATTVRRYEERLGRPLVALDWFTALAVIAATCITIRLAVLRDGAAALSSSAANPMVAIVERRLASLAG
jgi:aminoglycoside phosphotransferase (APT) family kinase protein